MDEAVAFADLNWDFSGEMDTTEDGTPTELERRHTQIGRRASRMPSATSRRMPADDLSPGAALRIDELEAQVCGSTDKTARRLMIARYAADNGSALEVLRHELRESPFCELPTQ